MSEETEWHETILRLFEAGSHLTFVPYDETTGTLHRSTLTAVSEDGRTFTYASEPITVTVL